MKIKQVKKVGKEKIDTINNKMDITLKFLGLFNDIDKYFDTLVDNANFMPYNEKIKLIKEAGYPISHYISQHENLLKFFGEIRNHISHGIKIDGHSFTLPSEHAISRIRQCRDNIVSPVRVRDILSKKVEYCNKSDRCKDIFPKVLQFTHIPVYHQKKIIGVLNQKLIAQWCIKNIQKNSGELLEQIKVGDIDVQSQLAHYIFITPQTDIHKVLDLFTKARESNKYLGGLLITHNGKSDGKLSGIITSADLIVIENQLQQKVIS